ncbi:uncharacterized protein LOC120846228 [Ixodes scapularis]|uniref:uncharacterized protein LOC120846228 n=1 Tax=Ixodes scapularis TaxID=6945 RepID=UPI001A9EE7A1|nr:uncharacterized protein LOC120846228 [Ixodes scapularis]
MTSIQPSQSSEPPDSPQVQEACLLNRGDCLQGTPGSHLDIQPSQSSEPPNSPQVQEACLLNRGDCLQGTPGSHLDIQPSQSSEPPNSPQVQEACLLNRGDCLQGTPGSHLDIQPSQSSESPDSPQVQEACLLDGGDCLRGSPGSHLDVQEACLLDKGDCLQGSPGSHLDCTPEPQYVLSSSPAAATKDPGNIELCSPICRCSKTMVAEVLLMILTLFCKHRFTFSALVDFLQLLNITFGCEVLPGSKYLFNGLFSVPSDMMSIHVYCNYCSAYIATKDALLSKHVTCAQCQTSALVEKLSYFITLPLAPQLKRMLESNPDIQNNLNYRFRRKKEHQSNIEDIYDGVLYKQLSKPGQILASEDNLSYTFNSDGASVFKSSNMSIWPIQVTINELPPTLRQKNLLLAGLWCGGKDTNMDMFFSKFADDAVSLATEGFSWQRHDGTVVNSKVIGLCCCVDSVARPIMQKTTQFNGHHGCSWCYHPGEYIENAMRYPVSLQSYSDRSDVEMEQQMETAFLENKTVFGVKGPSALLSIPAFGIVSGFVPDYMHAVLLGVARQITEMWVTSAREPFYIGSPRTMNLIDRNLENIRPPRSISRLPRSLTNRCQWKASEWKCWLFYYAIPCLKGCLPERYLKHFALLSNGIYILLKNSISRSGVNEADILLTQFVCGVQELYGSHAMTFNVHVLSHMAKSVKEWGPLWAHSAFPFESGNGFLLKLSKGTRKVPLQIAKNLLLYRSVSTFVNKYGKDKQVRQFCAKRMGHQDFTPMASRTRVKLLGKGKLGAISQIINTLCLGLPSQRLRAFKKVSISGEIYHSKEYLLAKRQNNSFVQLKNGKVGEIIQILAYKEGLNEKIVILFQEHKIEAPFYVHHVKECSVSDVVTVVPVESIHVKCLYIKVGGGEYFSLLPNPYEKE